MKSRILNCSKSGDFAQRGAQRKIQLAKGDSASVVIRAQAEAKAISLKQQENYPDLCGIPESPEMGRGDADDGVGKREQYAVECEVDRLKVRRLCAAGTSFMNG